MDKLSKKRRLPNPPKTSEDYPFNLLTELEKRKKRSNILVPLGLAYLLWKWSEPYEKRDRWEDRYKRRKVKVLHNAASGKWGVRWSEFDNRDRIVKKEKFFPTEEARERFAKNLQEKDNFNSFEAWSDPTNSHTTIKESELDKVVATLMEKGWSEKRIKSYLVSKAGKGRSAFYEYVAK